MSYKFTLGVVQWSTSPSGNVTCTLRYRPCPTAGNTPPFVVVSANVVVQPNGVLVTPVEQGGLTDGQCYEFQLEPNCGSAPKVKMLVVPAPGGTILITLTNALPLASISQFRIAGNNMLGGALVAGDSTDMNATAILDGTAKALSILLPASENFKFFHFKVIRGVDTVIDEGYFQSTGAFDTISSLILQHSDKITIREADEHLNLANYGDNGGTIVAPCNATLTLIRTSNATQDATLTNQKVRAAFTATGDNGCSVGGYVDFNPEDTLVSGVTVNLSCNATLCGHVTIVYTSLTVIS